MPDTRTRKRRSPRPPPAIIADRPLLTGREARVALGISRGQTVAEISDETGIAFETVRSVIGRLRDRTGRRRKTLLTVWAVEQRAWLQGIADKAADDGGGGDAP